MAGAAAAAVSAVSVCSTARRDGKSAAAWLLLSVGTVLHVDRNRAVLWPRFEGLLLLKGWQCRNMRCVQLLRSADAVLEPCSIRPRPAKARALPAIIVRNLLPVARSTQTAIRSCECSGMLKGCMHQGGDAFVPRSHKLSARERASKGILYRL